jgi:hypothetical protein
MLLAMFAGVVRGEEHDRREDQKRCPNATQKR